MTASAPATSASASVALLRGSASSTPTRRGPTRRGTCPPLPSAVTTTAWLPAGQKSASASRIREGGSSLYGSTDVRQNAVR